MHEILRNLAPGSHVLDLGSASGSYDAARYPLTTIRVDIEQSASAALATFVCADAAHLPFAGGSFHAVVCNHGLEHFQEYRRALAEIGRVTRSGGALYIAVPDAATFTDRLYRWLASGGGHVNAFRSAPALAAEIERITGLKHAGTRALHSSLSFLNPRNRKSPPPRKLLLLANGAEPVLFWLGWLLRHLDRLLGTRLSVYGWAFYFGHISEPLHLAPAINVCIRCGSGHPSQWLADSGAVQRGRYRCPQCGAENPWFGDAE